MKAYLFKLERNIFNKEVSLKKKEIEVEEKTKTFYCKEERRVFKKDNIGEVISVFDSEILLLEDDICKAASIFLEKELYALENLKEEIIIKENEIKDIRKYLSE